MKYISLAMPPQGRGLLITSPKITVPDQSMSLQEIIERFVRGEQLMIGRETFGEMEATDDEHLNGEDLEKLRTADMTVKAEHIERQKAVQKQFDEQEKRRKSAREKARVDKEREKIRQEERAKLDAERQSSPASK